MLKICKKSKALMLLKLDTSESSGWNV